MGDCERDGLAAVGVDVGERDGVVVGGIEDESRARVHGMRAVHVADRQRNRLVQLSGTRCRGGEVAAAVAQEDADRSVGGYIGRDNVERAVIVEVDEADGKRIGRASTDPDPAGAEISRAVAQQHADVAGREVRRHDIEVAIVVQVTERDRTRHLASGDLRAGE